MKKLKFIFLFLLLVSCTQQPFADKSDNKFKLESLSAQLAAIKVNYKPGLGDIMASVQMHHAKLWFSGIYSNWKLAEYEIKELKERMEQAKQVETDRPEITDIPIIYSAIDSVAYAIKQKNIEKFKSTFQTLTSTCNTCHKAVNFEFNIVTIPTELPVSNQDFKVHPK